MKKVKSVNGKAVFIPGDDIDTDRIIPARFMKCVTFDGLGEYMFYDVKYDQDGNKTKHNLNNPDYAEASIIVSGNNFGCGSSREHAPQAIAKAGFKAIIAEGYAEIFYGNCTQLGIPCAKVSAEDRKKIANAITQNSSLSISMDLEKMEITCGDINAAFTMKNANRDALLNGKWDPLSDLLENADEVKSTSSELIYF